MTRSEAFTASPSRPREFRRGLAFRRTPTGGRLYLFARRSGRVIALENDSVRQWRFWADGRFQGSRALIDFGRLLAEARAGTQERSGQLLLFPFRESVALARFFDLVPHEVWKTVIRFPRRLQFRMLSLLVRGGEPARQLASAEAHAALATLAAADLLRGRRTGSTTLRRWLRLPQRAFLGKLGFPDSRAAARVLRKISAEDCELWAIRSLRTHLHDSLVLRVLGHTRRIPRPVISTLPLLTTPRRVTPSLLVELSELPSYEGGRIAWLLARLAIPFEQVRNDTPEGTISRVFRSVAEVEVVAEAAREYAARNELLRTIPRAPWPDEPDGSIRWVRTPAELRSEGVEMNHCVFTYLDALCLGNAAVACLQRNGERATLLMERDALALAWRVGDLRGPCNAAVSPELRDWVSIWLLGRRGPRVDGLAPF